MVILVIGGWVSGDGYDVRHALAQARSSFRQVFSRYRLVPGRVTRAVRVARRCPLVDPHEFSLR